jgi:hypothetical protein
MARGRSGVDGGLDGGELAGGELAGGGGEF